MCAMKVAILFLILVSETTMAELELDNTSTNPDPGENSQLRESKEGKIPLRQLIRINNRAFDEESLLKDHIFQEEMMMLEVRSISTFQE